MIKSQYLHGVVLFCLLTANVAPAAVRYVDVKSTNPTPPYDSWPTAAVTIQDAVDAADPGDQIIVTNGVYQSGGRIAVNTGSGSGSNRVAVTKPLVLQSVNGPEFTVIQAYSSPVTNLGVGAMRCVYLTNGASLSGFTLANGATWAPWGAGVWCQSSNLVVVSNCVLVSNFAGTRGAGAYGGTLLNCVIRSNSTPPVSSAGGGAWGSILVNCTLVGNSSREGGGAAFCALTNCTLTANQAINGGGAAFCALTNCTLTGNQAINGGGAAGSRLYNCLVTGNSATERGGGTFSCVLRNCTVTENSAGQYGGGSAGGGFMISSMHNSISYFNTAPEGANYFATSYSFCCTTPDGGYGFTNAPMFLDPANGDFRLQSNSPCINSGLNAYAPAGSDPSGNPRIAGGTVDIGAYEFQSPASTISHAWLQQFGLPTDGSADYIDSDSDRLNNWQEWIAGTVPTDAVSALRLLTPTNGASGITVTWESVGGRTYFLERAGNLGTAPPFSVIASNIFGQPGITSFTDTDAVGPGPFFYRAGVQ